MLVGLRFPTEREKLLEEVAEYRHASAQKRFESLVGLSQLCAALLEASPNKERQIALLDRDEEEEHRQWRELIARHACR